MITGGNRWEEVGRFSRHKDRNCSRDAGDVWGELHLTREAGLLHSDVCTAPDKGEQNLCGASEGSVAGYRHVCWSAGLHTGWITLLH